MQVKLTIPNERANEFEDHINEQFEPFELHDMEFRVCERDFYTDFFFDVEEEEAEDLEAMAEFFQM